MNKKPRSVIYDVLRADAYTTINKSLRFAIGNNEAEIFAELLSRENYFRERDMLTEDEYFFNTIEDLWTGTNLSDYQQRIALRNLKNLGLIVIKVKGVPPKRFFKIIINPELITQLLEKGKEIVKAGWKGSRNHNFQETEKSNIKKLDIPYNKNNEDPEIDPERMRELSILLAAHEQGKPTRRQILQRSHSLRAQNGNGRRKRQA